MSLFTDRYDEEAPIKLPTYLQYCKSMGTKKRPKAYHIALIWLPNKFPSYAIETEHFRLPCGSSSLMGRAISSSLEEILSLEHSLHLHVEITEAGLSVFSFTAGRTPGSFVALGGDPPIGLKFVGT